MNRREFLKASLALTGATTASRTKGEENELGDKDMTVSSKNINQIKNKPTTFLTREQSGTLQSVVTIGGNNSSGQHQGVSSVMTGAIDGDAIYATKDGGIGYAVHGVNSSPNGSGGGFAADSNTGSSNGITGNRYNGGSGNGANGNRLGAGDGNGVAGTKTGSGTGSGTSGWNNGTGTGHGVSGYRQSEGIGHGVYGLREGTGAGDGMNAENNSTGAGHGLTVQRNHGGRSPKSVAYLGYYDNKTDESFAVYGVALGGNTSFAARFDGPVCIHGGLGVNGATPVTIRTLTGSRGGNAAVDSIIAALVAYGLVIDNTTA